MAVAVVLTVVGLGLVLLSAERLVDATVGAAGWLRISPFVLSVIVLGSIRRISPSGSPAQPNGHRAWPGGTVLGSAMIAVALAPRRRGRGRADAVLLDALPSSRAARRRRAPAWCVLPGRSLVPSGRCGAAGRLPDRTRRPGPARPARARRPPPRRPHRPPSHLHTPLLAGDHRNARRRAGRDHRRQLVTGSPESRPSSTSCTCRRPRWA